MAGQIIISNIKTDSDNAFSILANTGAVLFSANLASGITTGIADGSVTNAKLAGSITGSKIAATTITGDKITVGSLAGNVFTANTITGDKIGQSAISSNNISSITSSKLSDAGLVKITSGTLTTASAITADSVFTSTYVNYVIYINATYTGSASQDAYLQFRASGSTNSSAAYPYQVNYINAAVNSGTAASSSGAATFWTLYDNMGNGSIFNGVIALFNPQTSTKTTGQWFLYGEDTSNFKQMLGFGFQSQSTAFDGFTLTLQSGTLTGTYDVYGVAR